MEIVKVHLKRAGIDINALDSDEIEALRKASKRGDMKIVKSLFAQKGINVTSKHCTYEIANHQKVHKKHYYLCNTCGVLPPNCICSKCEKVCHKGHDVYEVVAPNNHQFICDCGAGNCLYPCKLITKQKETKNPEGNKTLDYS